MATFQGGRAKSALPRNVIGSGESILLAKRLLKCNSVGSRKSFCINIRLIFRNSHVRGASHVRSIAFLS
jgi:hypothetical protein